MIRGAQTEEIKEEIGGTVIKTSLFKRAIFLTVAVVMVLLMLPATEIATKVAAVGPERIDDFVEMGCWGHGFNLLGNSNWKETR